MPSLFDPLKIGELEVPNRILMAPLTRNRSSGPGRVPNALMRDYYVQRASAGLIISEATSVTPLGVGYPHTPGVWSDEQVAGWARSPTRVHAAGGRIFLQLWHVGRISDPSYHNGALPVAPSAIASEGPCQPAASRAAFCRAARAGDRRDPRRRRGVPQGAAERPGGGLRRGRDPRRERLSARPVPAGRHQPAHRRATAVRSRTARG